MSSYEKAYPKNFKNVSKIQQFYAGKTVFITGATGFLGRLLVEKLLRSCPDLKRIYIMVRPKKGKTSQERLKEYFNDPLYSVLQQDHSVSLSKLFIVTGDCCDPDLGLSENDRNTIISEVNCIFHVAATVRFNEKLRTATYINVRATRDLLELSKRISSLEAFVHVSTAYSFCPNLEIEESVYEPGMKCEDLLQLVEILDDKKLDAIQETVTGKWPNTYTFTKAVAEEVVQRLGAKLPITICRPSIVVPTAYEPVTGWTNNIFGPTGLFVGVEMGIIRVLQCKKYNKCELVPADFVINNIIAAGWNVGSKRNDANSLPSKMKVYNYISSNDNPITWDKCNNLGKLIVPETPPMQQIWNRFFIASSNSFLVTVLAFLLQTIPAYIIDAIAFCFGKSLNLVKTYQKINAGLKFITYFTMKEWVFKNDNVNELWNVMDPIDQKLFDFNINALDWTSYFKTFTKGVRLYILKESLDNLEKAKLKAKFLKVIHYLFCTVIILLLCSPIYFLSKNILVS